MQCENCEKITGGRVGKYGARRRKRRGVGVERGVPLANNGGAWEGGCKVKCKLEILRLKMEYDITVDRKIQYL